MIILVKRIKQFTVLIFSLEYNLFLCYLLLQHNVLEKEREKKG